MSEYVTPAIVELANGEGSTLACDNTCAIGETVVMMCGGACALAVIIVLPACCTS
jgi:hypothetical protein